ncbi:DUF1887 family protein [bacterium]|nr:DUF1887 family protein [candidate division CSSED10-310 bacterium]
MAHILVSLISDHSIPNFLIIRELPDVDRYLFISTEQMEEKKKTFWLCKSANLSPETCMKPIMVQEDSLVDIQDKLSRIEFDDDDRFTVNLTGGTKIMSIGVYNYFRNRDSRVLYVPIGKNVHRQIFPDIKNRERSIDYRMSVREYVTSYGLDYAAEPKLDTVRGLEDTAAFYRFHEAMDDTGQQILTTLRSMRKRKKKQTPLAEIPDVAAWLAGSPFRPAIPNHLLKEEIRYLTGDWFEESIFFRIRERLALPDGAVSHNLQLVRKDVKNEFDIVFTQDNRLHVVECKTAVDDEKRSIVDDALYKLGALQKDFGLNPRLTLVTLAQSGTRRIDITDDHRKRAEWMGIAIADRNVVQDADPERLIDVILRRIR